MDHLKKKILPARHSGTGNIGLSRRPVMENDRRQWAVVDFWNSTAHLENAS